MTTEYFSHPPGIPQVGDRLEPRREMTVPALPLSDNSVQTLRMEQLGVSTSSNAATTSSPLDRRYPSHRGALGPGAPAFSLRPECTGDRNNHSHRQTLSDLHNAAIEARRNTFELGHSLQRRADFEFSRMTDARDDRRKSEARDLRENKAKPKPSANANAKKGRK